MSPPPLEYVFKRVGELEIVLDVYLPTGATADDPASVCVWWHGGGSYQGTRKACPPNMELLPTRSNIAFISADYRLAPQSNIHLILEDTVDAIDFIRRELPGRLEGKIDPTKLAVSGGSAGGWLALLAGIPTKGQPGAVVDPPVTCIASIYPITDVDTAFYTTKQRPVSYWPKGIIPDDQAAPHIDPSDPELCSSSTTSSRSIVYHYALQEALWHHLWLVNAPTQSPGASTDPRSFNVGERLEMAKRDGVEVPPLFLTSGTADDKVDPAGAERLASRLKSLGCDYVWDERQGCDHLFDQDESERMERMHEFLQRHLL
ncbi:hypothetical protein FFLO_07129 [Filobasidium floriforme]|uniref:Alpha/beta hydrolase fold-3 domain-containing protein n=1 Tax=Filobasidium floriforme TaxID=5210 RepID=A0A8K0NPU1_9TREE|nr:hypothetical protein FFLO_07129 [Filobasidium floriforme]